MLRGIMNKTTTPIPHAIPDVTAWHINMVLAASDKWDEYDGQFLILVHSVSVVLHVQYLENYRSTLLP